MSKGKNQKMKILILMDFMLHRTDEEHPASIKQMQAYLEAHDITSERKSIYDDLETLKFWGLDIIQVGDARSTAYYVGERDFELAELKLMVDSVQSSKFITERKTLTLIQKIENLASMFDAQLLSRQVFVTNRIKSMNESIYYNIDAIHNGIARNQKIQFHYFEYTVAKERRLRHDGAFYKISPFALTWDDENYYMLGFDSDAGVIKHYRVDKMMDISVLAEPREGHEVYSKQDMASFSKKVFGMFHGEEKLVKLRFENHMVGIVMDRFGKDIMIIPDGPDHFTVSVEVAVSPQFYAWICGLGTAVTILSPDDVIVGFLEQIQSIDAQYERINSEKGMD